MIRSRYDEGSSSSSSSSSSIIRRCKKHNNNNYNTKNYGGVWSCEDLVLEILCRLPGKSLIRFKCVSKGWYFLISNVVIRRMLPIRLSGVYTIYRNVPGFGGIKYVSMMPDNRDDALTNPWPRSCSEIDIINKELPPGCSPFKVFPCDFLDCCNGLFLFFHRIRRQYYLWSREPPQFVMIPPPFDMPSLGYATIAFDVKESVHYRVVSFYDPHNPSPRNVPPRIRRLDIFYSETGKWIEYKVEYKPPLNDDYMFNRSIYLDGAIYRLSSSRHLVRYDLEQVNVTSFELPVITSIMEDRFNDNHNRQVIGLSSGCLHYACRDRSHLLFIWMFSDYQWILKRSVSFQELCKIPSTKDFFLEIPPTSCGFRPLAFHPCCDAVFLWSFRTILLYHYTHNEIQVIYFPPLDHNYSLRKPPHVFFPYSQCLVHLKTIG